jgi:hypothetical protein
MAFTFALLKAHVEIDLPRTSTSWASSVRYVTGAADAGDGAILVRVGVAEGLRLGRADLGQIDPDPRGDERDDGGALDPPGLVPLPPVDPVVRVETLMTSERPIDTSVSRGGAIRIGPSRAWASRNTCAR